MEGVVKHTHLRGVGHQLVNGTNTFQVASVVHRCQVAKALNAFLYALVNDDALLIKVATLHDAVSYGINLVKALDSAKLGVEQALEHEVYTLFVVGHVVHNLFLLAVGQCYFDERLVKADTLNAACCQHSVVVHVIEFVFD